MQTSSDLISSSLTSDEIYQLDPSTLSIRQEFALLARMLHRAGYNDGIAGHMSYKLDDGTLLVNPRELAWDELRARDIMHVTENGEVISGDWSVSPAVELHYVLHAKRDVKLAVHNHPEWSTVWSALGAIPPVYDQISSFMPQSIAFYPDYEGDVIDSEIASKNVEAMGHEQVAILANHGVFVHADNFEMAHMRCVALEHRAKLAWQVETLPSRKHQVMDAKAAQGLSDLIEEKLHGWPGFYAAMIRRELRNDQSVLD